LAETYFFIACRDEPPRSFKLLIALFTISEVGGWEGFVFGFFAFFCDAPDPFFGDAGAAGEEAG